MPVVKAGKPGSGGSGLIRPEEPHGIKHWTIELQQGEVLHIVNYDQE